MNDTGLTCKDYWHETQAVNKKNVKQFKMDGDMLFKVLKINEKILTHDVPQEIELCIVLLDFEMDSCLFIL